MAAKPLTNTMTDTEADDAWITAGGREGSVPNETMILLKNIQHQINDLDARVTVLETP